MATSGLARPIRSIGRNGNIKKERAVLDEMVFFRVTISAQHGGCDIWYAKNTNTSH